MWERKRGRLGLHTKSFKSSEALGAVMCRAVNWSWHSTVEKRTQNVQACQRHKRWGSGCRAREKGNTHRPHHFNIFAEKASPELMCWCLYIDTHVHTHSCMQRHGCSLHTEKDHRFSIPEPGWMLPSLPALGVECGFRGFAHGIRYTHFETIHFTELLYFLG